MLTEPSAQPVGAHHEQRRANEDVEVPLVIDVDGTLVRSDLLYESFFDTAALGIRFNCGTIRALSFGKAAIKRYLAAASDLDYATLPYETSIIDLVRQAKAQGRSIYLATAADERHAQAIVAHLNLFDGYFASDGLTDLSGQRKADALAAAFGEKGFDYVGNDASDSVGVEAGTQSLPCPAFSVVGTAPGSAQQRTRAIANGERFQNRLAQDVASPPIR